MPVNEEVGDGLDDVPEDDEPELVVAAEVGLAESGWALMVETWPAMVVSWGVMVATGIPSETDTQGLSWAADADVVVVADGGDRISMRGYASVVATLTFLSAFDWTGYDRYLRHKPCRQGNRRQQGSWATCKAMHVRVRSSSENRGAGSRVDERIC